LVDAVVGTRRRRVVVVGTVEVITPRDLRWSMVLLPARRQPLLVRPPPPVMGMLKVL
jgi:hypothetical protein